MSNAAPTITSLTIEPIVTEGEDAQFSAEAIDSGNDALTYLWDFGDGTESISGKTVSHTFADNGSYTTTLTVTDTHGAIATQTQSIAVANTAPIINAGADQTVEKGKAIALNRSPP